MPAPRLLIGKLTSEHLLVEPHGSGWEPSESADYWNDNWIPSAVRIDAGAFRGSYEALFRTDEFEQLRDQLRPFYDKLKGTATFDSMDQYLSIEITSDGIGHFTARCEARQDASSGDLLVFHLAFDQTELPAILGDLDELLRVYPVRGKRGWEQYGRRGRRSTFLTLPVEPRPAVPRPLFDR